MENISSIAMSRQTALISLMNMTANNIANMSTPGFKSENILFAEHLTQVAGTNEKISKVREFGSYRDISQGPLKQTFNNLDLAIQGDGFFKVETIEGNKYTRAGSFSLNSKGQIITKAGHIVLGSGNSPIEIPDNAIDIVIANDGTIKVDGVEVGKFNIVTFGNLQNLIPSGNNLFDAILDKEKPAENPHVEQGMLESSNVQPILEMTKMIKIQRMFQAAQNLSRQEQERQINLIQKLTRA